MPFHVFLSHSSTDKPAVEELARRLAGEGIQAWLDKWNLIPGDPWQPAIEKALAESETCAVFVGLSGFGPWQNEEMRAAIDQRVRDSGRRFRVIPVLLPGAERAERSSLPTFLAATTWVEFRDSLDDPDAFHRLVCGIRGREPGAGPGQAIYEGQCPYRGLRVFDVGDAPFFFGREALIQWLLNEVRPATEGQPVNRFLAIVGASGSGKSSVARAGLVAALKQDAIPGSAGWPVTIFRPGPDPVESLALALSRALNLAQSAPALAELIETFKKNEKTLHLIVRQSLSENASGMRLVILVDQFEEVFTLSPAEDLREALIRNLLYAAKVAQGQTLVILTMRADFYPKCAANAQLAAAFSDHHVLVGPMSEDELRRAIERPMQLVGGELEGGLVDLLLRDVRHQAGALPLLQHALLELWNKREGRRLTVKAYQEIGKLEGALQRRADATLEALSERERELCRRTFLRLTQPGEGTEDTKRRASLIELLSLADTSTAEESIIQKLANASLLTTEGDLTNRDAFVEVAHEALIRNWPQLRKWIDADRAGLRTRTRLTEAARDWKNGGHDPAYLYTGARLAVVKEWEASHPGELSTDEAEFLTRSLEAQRQREASELKAAQDLARAEAARAEEAEKHAKDQKDSANKLRFRAWIAAGLALVAVIFAGAVALVWQKSESNRAAAEDQARIAETRRLAAQTSEKKANDARDQGDGLINFMLYDLRDKLEPIGRLDVLDDVAKKAKGYLDSLPKEFVTAAHLKQQAAMLGNLGDVRVAQGKLQEALDAYQQSLAIFKRLAEQDKSNSDWQRDLSVSYNKVGDVLVAQGKLQEALDAYQQSLKIRQILAEQDKSNSDWQSNLAASYSRVGDVLVAQGKLQEAMDAYQQSLAIFKRLAEQDKSNSDWQSNLAASYSRVGDVLVAQGKLQEALDAYQQSLAIFKRLAEQDKSNSDWQRDLSVSYNKVGDVLVAQGKLQEALDAYQQSLAIFKRLADQDKSNSGWRRDLSVGYNKVGDVLVAQGKLQEALDAYQQSLKIRQILAEQDKSNSDWQRDQSVGYEKVGDVLVAQGKLQEALDAYQQSLAIFKRLAEQDKSNSDWQRNLSVGYEKVGDVLVAQGKLQEALDAYQQSLKIRQILAEQDKSNSGLQRDLSVGYEKVGDVLVAQGKLQEALDAYQQSLAIAKRLSEQDKSNSGLQRDLSVSYGKVGDVLVAQGKLQEALDAYQQYLAIAKRLSEQDKSNSGWQRDLSVSYGKVGNVLVAQGKLQEALDAYQQDLAIAKRLSEPDKSNSGLQRDLSVSYGKVGDVLVAQGKLQEALDAYQQSLAIFKRLSEQDKSNSGWQRDLSVSYNKVGNVLVAQGKLQEALDAYQQYLAIAKRLSEQDKSNSDWQRDLIISIYKIGATTAKIGTRDRVSQAREFLRTALNMADKYSGPDRQQIIDVLNQTLQNLAH